jgi:hypothetical protein
MAMTVQTTFSLHELTGRSVCTEVRGNVVHHAHARQEGRVWLVGCYGIRTCTIPGIRTCTMPACCGRWASGHWATDVHYRHECWDVLHKCQRTCKRARQEADMYVRMVDAPFKSNQPTCMQADCTTDVQGVKFH